MRRRAFITLLGGAAAAWPLAARAQQPMPVIGFLNTQSPDVFSYLVTGFRKGLRETGHVEGGNLSIEYRWAENQYDRLPALAADLVRRQVSVIAATGGSVSALAAKAATGTIPIVFLAGDLDAVQAGLVASIKRPGGNVTGVIPLISVSGQKRLELLHEMVPKAAVIGMLVNPDFPDADMQSRDLREAALNLGLQHHILSASSEPQFDTAFAMFRARQIDALLIGNDAFFNSRRSQLVALAARHHENNIVGHQTKYLRKITRLGCCHPALHQLTDRFFVTLHRSHLRNRLGAESGSTARIRRGAKGSRLNLQHFLHEL